jgi:hypothetical protein
MPGISGTPVEKFGADSDEERPPSSVGREIMLCKRLGIKSRSRFSTATGCCRKQFFRSKER